MKLSIITVNFNNKEGLQKTINSVIPQIWHNYEWIIIDGGSTDGSKELIEMYQDNFAYWCSEPDGGIFNAMNKGIAKAKGDYLLFMNSGDIFYANDTLEKVFATTHDKDILYGKWKWEFDDHVEFHDYPYPIDIYTLYKRNICHQAMFIKRKYHLTHLYDESYPIFADYKNWITAVLQGATFGYIPETICTVTKDGISAQNSSKSEKEYTRLRQESWPTPILLTLQELDYQIKEPYQLRVRALLSKNGVSRFLTLAFLKIMKLIFLRNLDEKRK